MTNYTKKLLFLSIILLCYFSIFLGFIYYSISNYAFTDFYKRLNLRRDIAAQTLVNNDNNNTPNALLNNDLIEELINQQQYIIKVNSKGEIIDNDNFDLDLWDRVNKTGTTNFKAKDQFISTKFYTINGENYIIAASAENYFYTHHLGYIKNILLISLGLAILFIILIYFYLKFFFLKPIFNMMKAVQVLGIENLERRIDEDKYSGELRDLAHTFNVMLNRLHTSLETQNKFISNASHELNTPLTSIIGQADLALSKERSTEDYIRIIKKISESAEHLEKKTSALLLLARTGFINNQPQFAPVRIDQIILDAELTVKNINDKFKIITDFSLLPDDSTRLKVKGNSVLLQLAISNIISNACKYSENRTAYIALGALDNKVLIVIKDNGIGIPEGELNHIYDTYFRASNTSGVAGYGIGLPLARNIIRMHEGTLKIQSTIHEGTIVEIELPTFFTFS